MHLSRTDDNGNTIGVNVYKKILMVTGMNWPKCVANDNILLIGLFRKKKKNDIGIAVPHD